MRKAEQHLAEAFEALSAERWDTTILLSIHAAMAVADAGCVASAGVRSVSQSHADQARLILQLLPTEEARRTASQLEALIDRKNTVEYEARRCSPEEAQISAKQAQRVIQWARTIVAPL
jgi:hypothetical protein